MRMHTHMYVRCILWTYVFAMSVLAPITHYLLILTWLSLPGVKNDAAAPPFESPEGAQVPAPASDVLGLALMG